MKPLHLAQIPLNLDLEMSVFTSRCMFVYGAHEWLHIDV